MRKSTITRVWLGGMIAADSRVFGPESVASVIGRVWLRYWPPSRFGVLEMPTLAP